MAKLYDLSLAWCDYDQSNDLETRLGNPTPRVAETPAGMLNAIGLQNPGLTKVMENEFLGLEQYDVPIIANVAGYLTEDYVEVAKEISQSTKCSCT